MPGWACPLVPWQFEHEAAQLRTCKGSGDMGCAWAEAAITPANKKDKSGVKNFKKFGMSLVR
jgi:hypothetical protein